MKLIRLPWTEAREKRRLGEGDETADFLLL